VAAIVKLFGALFCLFFVYMRYRLMMRRLSTTRTGSVHEWVGLWPHSPWGRINTCYSEHASLLLAPTSYSSEGLGICGVLVAS
jgi:hypothetical protein